MFRQSDEKPGRELFNSYQGVAMPLGSYKNKSYTKQDFKENFLKSTGTTRNEQDQPLQNGLQTTKFGKGFHRRNEKNIKNILAEEESKDIKQFQQTKAILSERLNDHRKETLKSLDNYNGYNILTNEIRKEAFNPSSNPHHQQLVRPVTTGIKPVPHYGLVDESMHRGQHMMRDSTARFYTPVPSGHRQNYRQDVLYREGLQSAIKHCGILEPKKKDLISYGIEDQFSKSEYYKPNLSQPPKEMTNGLFEKRIPGTYTPRNIPNHPSANPDIVHNWTTNVDIFNKSTKGYAGTKYY